MLEKIENELKTKGFSQKTIDSYLLYNKEFLKFTNKEPDKIEEQDIKNYLSYLTLSKKYKPRSINLALAALKFSFYNVLNKKIMETIKLQKLDKKSPTILTKEEVKSLIDSVDNEKHKLLLRLMVSSGLRVGEAISLKIADINFDERLLHVKSYKGKERLTILSDKSINDLKEYLGKRKDQNPYLFPIRETHISIKLPQKIIKLAAKKASLTKRVFCHALRSTFAHSLLESGVNIKYIYNLLGNSSMIKSEIYSKIPIQEIKKIKSPFEDI